MKPFSLSALIHPSCLAVILVSLLPCAAHAASTAERVLPVNPDAPLIIQARPDSSVVAWAVEEALPLGVVAVDISHGGRFDPYTNKVKWGPYLDIVHRDLACRLVAAGPAAATLTGAVSWDGLAPVPVAGETSLPVQASGFTSWLLQTFGTEILGRPDGDPRYDGDGDQIGLLAEYYFGTDPTASDQPGLLLDLAIPDGLRLVLTRRAAASGLETGFYRSADLANWAPFDPGLPLSQSADGELETLTYDLGTLPASTHIRLDLSE